MYMLHSLVISHVQLMWCNTIKSKETRLSQKKELEHVTSCDTFYPTAWTGIRDATTGP